jgi:hypothetical protein
MIRHIVRRLSVVVALASRAATLGAQGIVITGASSARYVDMRPLVNDSVPIALTDSATEVYRRTKSGVLVQCGSNGYCAFQRSGTPASLVALMQDLDVAAWGLGRGISFHGQLRARSAVGDARDLWPQANESVEAIAAYLDVDRDQYRARVGRQWLASGFGFFNFDGAALTLKPSSVFALEAYGGWSLVQGLNNAVTDEAVAAVEDLAPETRSYLFGGSLRWRPSSRGALRAQYQREIRTDRAALYSERVALDGEARLGVTVLSAALNRDLATGDFNEARVRLQATLRHQIEGSVQARHYEPFFALWTIWGAFDPVGYDEGRADLHWGGVSGKLLLGVNGGWRHYDQTSTGLTALPLRSDGWRYGISGSVRPFTALSFDGAYSIDVGFGASRSDGEGSIRWEPGERVSIGAHGVAFQNIYEFRVGTGRVIGGGVDVGLALRSDLRLVADAMVYRNTASEMPEFADWNQKRGSIRLEWSLGADPGRGFGGRRIP